MVETDPKKATPEEIAKGLELLKKQEIYKERVRKGELKGTKKWSDMSEEEKTKAREAAQKYAIKQQLFKEDAIKAGVQEPSPARVEAEYKRRKAAGQIS